MSAVSLTGPGDRTAHDLLSARRSAIRSAGRPSSRRVLTVAVVASATLVTATVLGVAGASAQPKPSIASVQRQVDQLQQEAEVATEQYNATRERLKSVNVMALASATRLGQQRKNVANARLALGKLAAQTYKAGDLQALSLLLDDDPDAVLAAAGLMTTMTDRQAQGVAHLVAGQKTLLDDQAEVAAQRKHLTDATNQLSTLSAQVKAKLAAANALLSQLKGTERAALLRASQSLDRQALTSLGVQVPSSGSLTCADVSIAYPNARVRTVLTFACRQLGKPYLWGGDGPGSYDCSGLSMQAWATVGVSLPHNAAMQAQEGTRVSISNLRPGDLLFFHSPISHDGIYIGKGLMIHAPHTGAYLEIAPARLSSAVAAVRL